MRGPSDPARPPGRVRRGLLACGLLGASGLLRAQGSGSAASDAELPAWLGRLQGEACVLLGEVHDNPVGHARRLQHLQAALGAGWRPAVAMEQFDRERQADIDRARRERPDDADHLITQAGGKGWDWAHYRPVIALALARGLPLLAANVSAADARQIVRGGYGSVFDATQQAELGLDRPLPADWQAGQEREIDTGHCGALPATLWPAMARAQFARDAVMARLLGGQVGRGAVLLAGNGHVRRDLGVTRWLAPAAAARCWVVGYLESPVAPAEAARYDAVVPVPTASRPDPCEAFRQRATPR
jgi:uncharacterized iron-regulated protein